MERTNTKEGTLGLDDVDFGVVHNLGVGRSAVAIWRRRRDGEGNAARLAATEIEDSNDPTRKDDNYGDGDANGHRGCRIHRAIVT